VITKVGNIIMYYKINNSFSFSYLFQYSSDLPASFLIFETSYLIISFTY